MAHPTAVVFALTMAVWVADVRFAPKRAEPAPAPIAACESGINPSTPANADLEIVTCGTRLSD